MSGALIPFNQPGGLSRDQRRFGRALTGIEYARRFGLAQIEAEADLQAARADGVAYVAQAAEKHTAMLSQLEVQLSQLVPAATSRLQAIGDIAALSLAEVVVDTARRVR